MDRGAVHRAVLHTDSEVCVLQIRKNALARAPALLVYVLAASLTALHRNHRS